MCGKTLRLMNEGDRWESPQLAGFGYNAECAAAPNPDEGPMPPHQPVDVIAWRPGYQPINEES